MAYLINSDNSKQLIVTGTSGHILPFVAWARVQMTGMANWLNDLVPCPSFPQNDYSVSLTVLLVRRPSNGNSLEHSQTRLAGLTSLSPARKTTIVSRSRYQQTRYIERHFSTHYLGQVCDMVECACVIGYYLNDFVIAPIK